MGSKDNFHLVGWVGTQFGDSNTRGPVRGGRFQFFRLSVAFFLKSEIFDVVLKFLNKPLFEGWPTNYFTLGKFIARFIENPLLIILFYWVCCLKNKFTVKKHMIMFLFFVNPP